MSELKLQITKYNGGNWQDFSFSAKLVLTALDLWDQVEPQSSSSQSISSSFSSLTRKKTTNDSEDHSQSSSSSSAPTAKKTTILDLDAKGAKAYALLLQSVDSCFHAELRTNCTTAQEAFKYLKESQSTTTMLNTTQLLKTFNQARLSEFKSVQDLINTLTRTRESFNGVSVSDQISESLHCHLA
jgi:hypothetical protein